MATAFRTSGAPRHDGHVRGRAAPTTHSHRAESASWRFIEEFSHNLGRHRTSPFGNRKQWYSIPLQRRSTSGLYCPPQQARNHLPQRTTFPGCQCLGCFQNIIIQIQCRPHGGKHHASRIKRQASFGTSTQVPLRWDSQLSSASWTPFAPSRRVHGKGSSATTCLRKSSHWILKALSKGS